VAFSPDGGRIVSGSYDKSVRVWDAASGAELACLSGHEEPVTSVAFSADGGRIVSGSLDNSVRVWDAASGECLEGIEGTGDVEAIAAGNDQRPYRALARSGETVIEDGRSGAIIAVFPIELDSITTHRSGRQWAGAVGNHVYLLVLEGDPSPNSD
jgi:WD40 repeat protein